MYKESIGRVEKKETCLDKSLFLVHYPGMELLIMLYVLPSFGPKKFMTAMTTMATRARMIAYSTSPCPRCSRAETMLDSFQKKRSEYLLRYIYCAVSIFRHNQEALSTTGLLFARESGLRQGAGDGAECVADLGTEQTHDSNHHDGDEGENDRVLDETLAFFLWCEQHIITPF